MKLNTILIFSMTFLAFAHCEPLAYFFRHAQYAIRAQKRVRYSIKQINLHHPVLVRGSSFQQIRRMHHMMVQRCMQQTIYRPDEKLRNGKLQLQRESEACISIIFRTTNKRSHFMNPTIRGQKSSYFFMNDIPKSPYSQFQTILVQMNYQRLVTSLADI